MAMTRVMNPPLEVDYNHPDADPQTIYTTATEIVQGEDDTLYIYIPRDGIPSRVFQKQLNQVSEAFKKALPETTVIVGAHDLKFTNITKKQEFKAKLDGTL